MKKEIFLRSIALLVAIVLTTTFTFGNYSFVSAEETSTGTEDNKELVQCSDDWVIFKYEDENGEPAFDIKYQNKTVEELKNDGLQLQYFIIIEGDTFQFYINEWFNVEDKTSLDFSKNKYKIQFRLIQNNDNEDDDNEYDIISISDAFALNYDTNSTASILHSNMGYSFFLSPESNTFRLELKVNKYLKQIENLSISANLYCGSYDLSKLSSNTTISNISLKSYSNTYTIEGEKYTLDYSIISCDIYTPSVVTDSSTFDISDANQLPVNWSLSFDGFNCPIENFLFIAGVSMLPNGTLVDTIKISTSSSNIIAGKSVSLTTKVLPDTALNKKLNWFSSNEAYATVDENGIVTAKPAGVGKSVVITAKATDGSNVTSNYTLNIISGDHLVKSIKITSASSSVKAGKTITLKANVNSSATNKNLTWSSSNTKYATVNKNGVVTTKSAGAGKTVTITAKATDGSNVSASFNLKINKVLVNKIKLKASKSVKVGKKLKIKLTINSDATNKTVKWSVSNKKYAKINSKGVLTAKKAGKGKTVKVTAKATDGSGKKTTIKIKIKK